jgi:hypothetical protein
VTENSSETFQLDLDLGEVTLGDLQEIDFSKVAKLVLRLPLPSVGRTNMHSDICSDMIDASWAAERLALASDEAVVESDYSAEKHRSTFRLVLTRPHPDIFCLDTVMKMRSDISKSARRSLILRKISLT